MFSVFTTVSVAGVVLGVAALTVVLSVTSGFQAQFREKVLGVNAHVLVMKSATDFANYRDIEEIAASLPHVRAVQPFLLEEMLVTRGKGESPAVLMKGVDPDRAGQVLDLPKHMVEGSVSVLKEPATSDPPPIIIGRELSHKLKAKVGDVVTIVSPLSGINVRTWSATGRPPKTKKFVVKGVFYSGFDEYDRRLMYVDLKEAQDFLEQGDVVRGVEMKLDDVEKAPMVAALIDEKLGGDPYVVMDWRKLNNNLFTALTLQKVALLLFLTLIIVVAAFNMVAALTMMVVDKTKEIAIIKSMGGTDMGVARIFQVVGLCIGGVGTAVGVALGLLLCHVVARFGYPLDPKVYLIDRLPVRVNPWEVVLVAAITMLICMLATLYPALKGSSLRPVDGLRYE
ncbi:MAG: ABC transporter permease [Deltaproteobacteria bacterium]|nr:ABC transporter permease [Deltaproteobacteria bacterium]